ncbi:hypothetical protein ACE2AJ_18605 [Aquihabitans daechungensis]|uniref:hypothetical protein n=1 Tax=Aquihabitans daechungensis TaxID=1052257 RepID=UPI003B9FA55A
MTEGTPTRTRPPFRAPAIAWNWSEALFGLAAALPAAVIALDDVTRGVAFAVGVLPPAVVGSDHNGERAARPPCSACSSGRRSSWDRSSPTPRSSPC